MDEKLILKTTEGIYNEREDWWHLVKDAATGAQSVTHTWQHMNTEKLYLTESEGCDTTPAISFLEVCADGPLKKSLQKLMDEDNRA